MKVLSSLSVAAAWTNTAICRIGCIVLGADRLEQASLEEMEQTPVPVVHLIPLVLIPGEGLYMVVPNS